MFICIVYVFHLLHCHWSHRIRDNESQLYLNNINKFRKCIYRYVIKYIYSQVLANPLKIDETFKFLGPQNARFQELPPPGPLTVLSLIF
jgi:hypothetical protein